MAGRELVGQRLDVQHLALTRRLDGRTVERCRGVVPAAHRREFRLQQGRLGAEVLIDAICQITRTTESYSSEIPEPFTFIPQNQRSIKLSDGSITSPFLDLYGRPPRDTGYESERNNTPSSSQKLHLLNSTHIQQKIMNNKQLLGMYYDKTQKRKKPAVMWHPPEDAIEGMYLTILSRYPTDAESNESLAYIRDRGLNRFETSVDLVWALLNTKEFIYKH